MGRRAAAPPSRGPRHARRRGGAGRRRRGAQRRRTGSLQTRRGADGAATPAATCPVAIVRNLRQHAIASRSTHSPATPARAAAQSATLACAAAQSATLARVRSQSATPAHAWLSYSSARARGRSRLVQRAVVAGREPVDPREPLALPLVEHRRAAALDFGALL